VVGLLCLVGFVGNALTIAVLRRDWQDGSNATNWLLRTLAGVDTFYLIACLFVQTFNTVYDLTDWFPDALASFLLDLPRTASTSGTGIYLYKYKYFSLLAVTCYQ